MRELWKIFKHSTALPKRQAAFQLNRIGMDKIIFYLFALLAIASIPELIDQISQNEVSSALYMKTFFFLIFFFIFYYLTLVVIMLTALSGIAYIGSLIATRTKRKVRYSILWKMAFLSAVRCFFRSNACLSLAHFCTDNFNLSKTEKAQILKYLLS